MGELVKIKDDLGTENNQNFHYEMLNQELVAQNEKLAKEMERMSAILAEYARGNTDVSDSLEQENIVHITIEPVEDDKIPENLDISSSHYVNEEHCYARSSETT